MSNRARNLKNNNDLSFKDRKRLIWMKERKIARQQSLELQSRRNLDEWNLMGEYFDSQTSSSIDNHHLHQTHLEAFINSDEVDSPTSPLLQPLPPQTPSTPSTQPSTSSTPELNNNFDDSIQSWNHCDDGRDFEMFEQPTLLPPI